MNELFSVIFLTIQQTQTVMCGYIIQLLLLIFFSLFLLSHFTFDKIKISCNVEKYKTISTVYFINFYEDLGIGTENLSYRHRKIYFDGQLFKFLIYKSSYLIYICVVLTVRAN